MIPYIFLALISVVIFALVHLFAEKTRSTRCHHAWAVFVNLRGSGDRLCFCRYPSEIS